jgi:hypothetical protein
MGVNEIEVVRIDQLPHGVESTDVFDRVAPTIKGIDGDSHAQRAQVFHLFRYKDSRPRGCLCRVHVGDNERFHWFPANRANLKTNL